MKHLPQYPWSVVNLRLPLLPPGLEARLVDELPNRTNKARTAA